MYVCIYQLLNQTIILIYLLHATSLHLFNNIEVPTCLHTEIKWQIFLRMQIGTLTQ